MISKRLDTLINVTIILCFCMFMFIVVGAIYVSYIDKDLKNKLESNSKIMAICDLNVTEPNIDEIMINCKLN